MSRDTWGKGTRKPKDKRDAWAKPKRGKRRREFGAVPKRGQAKQAKAWGKPERRGDRKISEEFGGSSHRRLGILASLIKPRRLSIREYYRKLDEITSERLRAETGEIPRETREAAITDRLTRFVEGILRRRLSSGQVDQVKQITREVISPKSVIAFVTNVLKAAR